MARKTKLHGETQVDIDLTLLVPQTSQRFVHRTLWPQMRDILRRCATKQPENCTAYVATQLIREMNIESLDQILETVQAAQLSLLFEEAMAIPAPFQNTDIDRGCTSKEKNYRGAFEESGGDRALKAHAQQSRLLSKRVNSRLLAGYSDVATEIPQTQRFEYEAMPLTRLRENICRFLQPQFEKLCTEVALLTQGQVLSVAPMSTLHARCKAAVHHGDYLGEITKFLRCAIAYPDIQTIYAALERIINGSELQRCDTTLLTVEDRLQNPQDPAGWRDIELQIKVNGHLCQICLQLLPMVHGRSGSSKPSCLIPFLDGTHLGNSFLISDLLFLAAARCDESLCQRLLEVEADPSSAMDRNNRTALHCAAYHGVDELCLKILDPESYGLSSKACSACCEDKVGELPFATAFLAGHIATARLLLRWAISTKKAPLSQNGDWQCKMLVDLVLDKVGNQERRVTSCPLDQKTKEEAKAQELKDFLKELEEFGYAVEACDRLSTIIALGVVPVICALAKMRVHDRDGRSALMLVAEASSTGGAALVDCARYMLTALSPAELELNTKDIHGKTAVDYALEYGQEKIGALLMDCGAVDGHGHDIFSRAVRDNNAHFVQHLWQVRDVELETTANDGHRKLMLVPSSPGANGKQGPRATLCTCFIPTAKCDQGEVRYPLVFAQTFPRTKRLSTDPGANKVLDYFRNRHLNNVKSKARGTSLDELTGFDGCDIYNGLIPCWICGKAHDQKVFPAQSWVGPVHLALPAEAPQVRLFMHHTCAASLEQVLATGKAGQDRAVATDKRLWRSNSGHVGSSPIKKVTHLSPLDHTPATPAMGGLPPRSTKWR